LHGIYRIEKKLGSNQGELGSNLNIQHICFSSIAYSQILWLRIGVKFPRLRSGQARNLTNATKKADKIIEKLGVKLGVNEAGILELIIRDKFITIVQLAKELHISTTKQMGKTDLLYFVEFYA